jgi:hypothetical protein
MAGTADQGSVARRAGRAAISVPPQTEPDLPERLQESVWVRAARVWRVFLRRRPGIIVDGIVSIASRVRQGWRLASTFRGPVCALEGVAIVIALVQQRDEARAFMGEHPGQDAMPAAW